MKKIFAKELAALAVLALAFTGCNTAFDGTNANFSEKEAQYTDRSGAGQSISGAGSISTNFTGTTNTAINNTNKKNVVDVTITSFSKINVESADKAIHFQQLTNNSTSGYYPIRGADLPKTRIKVDERTGTGTFNTTITYEVDGTGVTATSVALFVDAKELKTKGGTLVLTGDGNLTRGEESDSYIEYLITNGTTTTITGTEVFARPYSPFVTTSFTSYTLVDTSSKFTGVTRLQVTATNKAKPGDAADYEKDLAAKFNDAVVLQYREPGKREYSEKKLSWTYHDSASTATPANSDPYDAHTYTADVTLDVIGTEWRVIYTKPEGLTAPAWYKDVYGHAGVVYGSADGAGKKSSIGSGTYVLHKTVPTYIVQTTGVTTGPDASSSYNPAYYYKTSTGTTIADAQDYFLAVTNADNWFEVRATNGVKLNPTACSDFILVDNNNKKIASEVQVITKSYNDSTPGNGDVDYVKILIKDVRYRNYSSLSSTNQNLSVAVGKGTKIVENKIYPSQVTFGIWEDVADDDLSGYCKIQ